VSYPNEWSCKHGRLSQGCELCEMEAELAELRQDKARLDILEQRLIVNQIWFSRWGTLRGYADAELGIEAGLDYAAERTETEA